MSELHQAEFLALLKKSDLLSQSQWETAQTAAKTVRTTAEAYENGTAAIATAAELVRQHLLTEWQAGQLLKGQTGFVLQQYRLLAPVGKGGMGHVFRARDDRSGAIVAIKVMSRKLTGNQTLVNRFRREIRASSLLQSPHIVRTLDAGRVGKVDFMVMEYVNGDQLDRVASRVSAVPVSMACDVIRQAAIGLQHAHEQRMVHRDIKPANLIVDWSADGLGIVKIMDMGLVRLGDDDEHQTTVTRAGQVMGTPDYMSPEQGWDTATVDIRSDIYSLGCSFFRLLTGRVPFPGDNPLQVLMARCSRDAPSAKSLRADLPDSVDAVLRKMTLRDPAGRFQTPQELADALAPLCTPLTIEGLRRAMREAGADDAVLLTLATASENPDLQDAGYQQFLREMDSGAAVDLMMTTNAGLGQALSQTLPVLPRIERLTTNHHRSATNRNRTASVIVLASASALSVLLVLLLLVNRNNEELPTQSTPVADTPPVPVPEAKLVAASPMKVQTGQTLLYQPTFEGDRPMVPVNSELIFRLGSGAPAFVEIDADSGAVKWKVSTEQTPAEYSVPVEFVFFQTGRPTVIASTTLSVVVEAALSKFSLISPEPQWVMPNEAVAVALVPRPVPDAGAGLEFRLGSGALPGMVIDPKSGEFSWTPTDDQKGKHDVTAVMVDSQSSRVLADTQLTLRVIAMPVFAEQRVQAGELLQIELPKPPAGLPAKLIRLRVAEGSPPGVTIDLQAGQIRWQVPADATGRHEIRLRLDEGLPNRRSRPDVAPESVIVVNVTPAAPVSMVPSEADVAAARRDLRELFKKELSTARAVADRAVLARLLLERSFDQTPGASDFALLDLAAEQADRGRAADVALEVNRIRSERYQTDELAAAKNVIAEFRPASLNPRQQDATVEHCLRLASAAVSKQQFAEAAALLTPPDVLLRRVDRSTLAKQLAQDVARARVLAEDLSRDDSAVVDTKVLELARLLQRWQFADLFAAKDSFSYVQAGTGATTIPDSGRSLWKFENDRIRLETGSQPLGIGFLDTGSEPARYLIRMQLAARTTSAVLIFGAGPEQNLNAYLLTLDSSAFGRISLVPGLATVVSSPPNTTLPKSGWNDVEILVDGPLVTVRLNGTAVMNSQVNGLKPGRLGMLVSLERAVPAPVFDMREPRILALP